MAAVDLPNAAGVILWRDGGVSSGHHVCEYLLLQARYGGHWTPPKGHVDVKFGKKKKKKERETAFRAALREMKEETSIGESDVEICEETWIDAKYILPKPTRKVPTGQKVVRYFIGRLCSEEVKVCPQESEVSDFRWVKLDEALALVEYDEMQRVLRQAAAILSDSSVSGNCSSSDEDSDSDGEIILLSMSRDLRANISL